MALSTCYQVLSHDNSPRVPVGIKVQQFQYINSEPHNKLHTKPLVVFMLRARATCSGHRHDDSFPVVFPEVYAGGDEALQGGVHGPVDLQSSRLLSDLQPQDVQHSRVQPAHTASKANKCTPLPLVQIKRSKDNELELFLM